MKYCAGTRVRWRNGGELLTGHVVGRCKDNPLRVRVKTDGSRGISSVPVRRLSEARNQVLLLESRLDRSLRSQRAARDVFVSYLSQAHDLRPLYERVHHRDDVSVFTQMHGKQVRIVHVVCHGESDGRDTLLHLTRDKVFLRKNGKLVDRDTIKKWAVNLAGKILLLSCCEVGRDREAIAHLVCAANLAAAITYRKVVTDRYSYIGEPLLYELLLGSRKQTYQGIRKSVVAIAEFLYDQRIDHTTLNAQGEQIRSPLMQVTTLTDAKRAMRG